MGKSHTSAMYQCPLCGWKCPQKDARRIRNHEDYHSLMEDRPDPTEDRFDEPAERDEP